MFKKHRQKPTPPSLSHNPKKVESNAASRNGPPSPVTPLTKNSLEFHCQWAHGSPTILVSGFSNVKELYHKIAEGFETPVSEILFCTLNTYRVDMKKILGGQIGLEDLIFAHKKGRAKEVELVKSEEALGLTITDNGNGYAFIKRIKEGSIIDSIGVINVGDHIEKLDDQSVVGKKHFEVARMLKDIPVGETFKIRLVEPLKSDFSNIGPKNSSYKKGAAKKGGILTGKETLRFKAGGNATIEQQDEIMDAGIEKINNILENFLGINDSELATQIWEISEGKTNSMDFADAIDDSDLSAFEFTDELVIEIWGAITDARDGR